MPNDGFNSQVPVELAPTAHTPLNIAFTFDSYASFLSSGYTPAQLTNIEYVEDKTIAGVTSALSKIGIVEKIDGVHELTRRLASEGKNRKPKWDIVFNLCEGQGQVAGREAQVPALLEAWRIPHAFSDSATMALCLDKARAKMVCEYYRVPTAPFAVIPPRNTWLIEKDFDPYSFVTNSPHALSLAEDHYPLFVKPSSTGGGIGISQNNKASGPSHLRQIIEKLSAEHPESSLLVETFLPGREFTVGILGTGSTARVIGIREFVFLKDSPAPGTEPFVMNEHNEYLNQEVYGHITKTSGSWDAKCPNPWSRKIELTDPLAQRISEVTLDAWRALGCRDAGRIDIRMNKKVDEEGVPNFVEVNPIPGLVPDWSDLAEIARENGMEYDQLIIGILDQACQRLGKPGISA